MPLTQQLGLLCFVLGLALLGGCSESLFGASSAGHGPGTDAGAGGDASPCSVLSIANAGVDFDPMSDGACKRWRYLEDNRDRTWTDMTAAAGELIGRDPGNRITTCAAHPSSPACTMLPGALLVSSAGTMADPAIELRVPASQVIQLKLQALVPAGGAPQTFRLYRNSREDELFTATPSAGTKLEKEITLDALAGDRFLVAVAPGGPGAPGASDVGLQLIAMDAGRTFPSTCQLAVPFASASGNTVDDLCGGSVLTHYSNSAPRQASPPALTPSSSFMEQGLAATLHTNQFFERDKDHLLAWTGDVTAQFWVRLDQPISNPVWLFADQDPDQGGGIGISVTSSPTSNVGVDTWVGPQLTDIGTILGNEYPFPNKWHFVRVVRAGNLVRLCINGQYKNAAVLNAPVPSNLMTIYPLKLGIDNQLLPSSAVFEGLIDDVRVISTALPCG